MYYDINLCYVTIRDNFRIFVKLFERTVWAPQVKDKVSKFGRAEICNPSSKNIDSLTLSYSNFLVEFS